MVSFAKQGYFDLNLTLTNSHQNALTLITPRILTSMRGLLEQIGMQFNQEQAVAYHYDQFPPKELDYAQLVDPLLKATDALARYDQMLKGLHESEILLAPLRDQEAVASSRIEGTVSTMDEILRYAADNGHGTVSKTNVRSDVIETFLYRRALLNIQYAMESGYQLTASLLKQAHKELLSFGRGASKSPGQYKNSQNYLADARTQEILFVPISPERLNDGLEILFDYIKNSDHPNLIKTALAHVEFEALHPFEDGNGRIGRMLISLMLWDSGVVSLPHFYMSRGLEEERDFYIDKMRNVSENGDWESWCVFFLEIVNKQAIQSLQVAENIRNLFDEMKVAFAECLSSRRSINALEYVFKYPVYRNNQFVNNAGIPPATAARFTRELLQKNLIEKLEEPSGNKSALYSFELLLKLVRV